MNSNRKKALHPARVAGGIIVGLLLLVAVLADDITLELGDGFYIFRDKDEPTPDYIILSITEYQPLKLEVERYHG